MNMLGVFLITAYLTYYTFTYARTIWEKDNKVGSIAVGLVATTFIPLALFVYLSK